VEDKKVKYVRNTLHVVQHHPNVKIPVKVKNGEKQNDKTT